MQALNLLRTLLTADLPVRVRRVPLHPDSHGYCERKKKVYIVKVNNTMCEDQQIEVLCHEWAHCLVWTSSLGYHSDHDAMWGVAYASCYRVVRDLIVP